MIRNMRKHKDSIGARIPRRSRVLRGGKLMSSNIKNKKYVKSKTEKNFSNFKSSGIFEKELNNKNLINSKSPRIDDIKLRYSVTNIKELENEEDFHIHNDNFINLHENDNIDELLISKSRPRHKINNLNSNINSENKRSKTNYIKHPSQIQGISAKGSVKLGDLAVTRPNYDKISFKVTFPKYFGKDEKILEINNNGFFKIYKKGKVSKIKL
jgi:hypothetical protein